MHSDNDVMTYMLYFSDDVSLTDEQIQEIHDGQQVLEHVQMAHMVTQDAHTEHDAVVTMDTSHVTMDTCQVTMEGANVVTLEETQVECEHVAQGDVLDDSYVVEQVEEMPSHDEDGIITMTTE